MVKILNGKLSTKMEQIILESNLPNNYYYRKLKNAKLSALRRLYGFDEYLYLTRLIESSVEAYRKFLISEIDEQISIINNDIIHLNIERAKLNAEVLELNEKNKFNILLNNEHTIKNMLSKLSKEERENFYKPYVITNFSRVLIKDINQNINLLDKQILQLKNNIEDLRQQKQIIINKTSNELKNEFDTIFQSKTDNYRKILAYPITQVDKLVYKLMGSEKGYIFLQSKLDDIKRLEKNKEENLLKVEFSQNIPLSVLNYLEKNFNISNNTLDCTYEDLLMIKSIIQNNIKQIPEIKEKMTAFSPKKYQKIMLNKDCFECASLLIQEFNFYNEKWTNNNYKNIVISYNYNYDYYKEYSRLLSNISKRNRNISRRLYSKLLTDSSIIINLTSKYIIDFYRRVIYLINTSFNTSIRDMDYLANNYNSYLNDLDDFEDGLKIVLQIINDSIKTLELQNKKYDDEINIIKSEIFTTAEIYSSYNDISYDIDLFETFEDVYLKEVAKDLDSEIIDVLGIKNPDKLFKQSHKVPILVKVPNLF